MTDSERFLQFLLTFCVVNHSAEVRIIPTQLLLYTKCIWIQSLPRWKFCYLWGLYSWFDYSEISPLIETVSFSFIQLFYGFPRRFRYCVGAQKKRSKNKSDVRRIVQTCRILGWGVLHFSFNVTASLKKGFFEKPSEHASRVSITVVAQKTCSNKTLVLHLYFWPRYLYHFGLTDEAAW